MMDAYHEGMDAFGRGDDINLNPFDDLDAQYDEWEDGWIYAEILEYGDRG